LVDLGGATVREHVGHSSSEPNTELIEGDFFTDPLPNLYWSYQRAPGRTAGTVRTNDVDFGRSS
jgi:arginine deiminase